MTDRKDILKSLVNLGYEVITARGGFHLKGQGFISTGKARKLTGIIAPKRQKRGRISAWGDWATVAMMNGVKR